MNSFIVELDLIRDDLLSLLEKKIDLRRTLADPSLDPGKRAVLSSKMELIDVYIRDNVRYKRSFNSL